jgi:hypothetical protein
MEAIFFTAAPEQALGLCSSDDLVDAGVEPAGEPLPLPSPAALMALVSALGTDGRHALAPLRDATCRSFPVWKFSAQATSALARLDAEAIDAVAARTRTSSRRASPTSRPRCGIATTPEHGSTCSSKNELGRSDDADPVVPPDLGQRSICVLLP